MSDPGQTSYDEIPYGSNPFSYTHPGCLAGVATLSGLAPPPVERCRVLELGCARGGNLIPMAQSLPAGRFVGIDLSRRQIAEGRAVVERLGLGNIRLEAMSILDVDEGFGEFDYIICHGVYSWVPAEVQDRILEICAANLVENGIAYVSYNTYPGWHLRATIRETMAFHVQQFDDPQVRIEQARLFLNFLVRAARGPNSVYGRLLKQEADFLSAQTDSYLFHEHLEEENHPLYFHQFNERASARKLQYLAEARPSALASQLPPDVTEVLAGLSTDHIRREQYLDFLCNGTFRRSLLCHARAPVDRPRPERLTGLRLVTKVKPVSERPDVRSDAVEEFRSSDGVSVSTNRPLVKAALLALFEVWPDGLDFSAVWAAVQSRLGDAAPARLDGEAGVLAEALLRCYMSDLVEVHAHAPRFVREASTRPLASPLARLQAETGTRVTNLRHQAVDVGELEGVVLRFLDGSRDRPALLECVVAVVASGEMEIHESDWPLRDESKIRELLGAELEPALHRLARSALLLE
jgi:methyltransferase-like protein/cyclopropane fatty-acyl-phospholipid synthase-like methyltransferase